MNGWWLVVLLLCHALELVLLWRQAWDLTRVEADVRFLLRELTGDAVTRQP